jgi:hypothetical protein
LINKLTENKIGFSDIFIETNGLKKIHPIDMNVFQKNLNDIKKHLKKLIIVGVNQDQIAPN